MPEKRPREGDYDPVSDYEGEEMEEEDDDNETVWPDDVSSEEEDEDLPGPFYPPNDPMNWLAQIIGNENDQQRLIRRTEPDYQVPRFPVYGALNLNNNATRMALELPPNRGEEGLEGYFQQAGYIPPRSIPLPNNRGPMYEPD